jgi:hypothetical protein
MATSAAVSNEFDLIQRHLLPQDSVAVRYCMDRASEMTKRRNFFTKHFFPLPFLVAAVAFSFFNAISYFLQIPFITLLNIVRLEPLCFLTHPLACIINALRSALFVGLGLPLLIAGVVFPEAVFIRFAPDVIVTKEGRLVYENKMLREQIFNLKEEIHRQKLLMDAQAIIIQNNTGSSRSILDKFKFWQRI